MADKHRTEFGTFQLRAAPDGIVHLDGKLPRRAAIGDGPLREMADGVWPLGGPHCTVDLGTGRIAITTPEAEFVYVVTALKQDKDGWYYLAGLQHCTTPELRA